MALLGGCNGEVYGGAEADEVSRALDIVPTCPSRGTRAHDVRVESVALYQALKVPLYQDGRWLSERPVPIIAGKEALVRVFVQPDAEYRPRPLRAVLRIAHGDHVDTDSEERRFTARSRDEARESTFNFEVAASLITPDAKVSVALEESDCVLSHEAEERAKAAITTPLGAERRRTLRVVLVPMRVGARVPSLTASKVEHITEALRAFFPVPEVEVRVDAVIPGEPVVAPDEEAHWYAMLDRVRLHRAGRAPEDDVYYVGLFQPAASRDAYCAVAGCQLGFGPVAKPHMVNSRYAIAAFFGDESGGETVAHELGHAHGLEHAPCPGQTIKGSAAFPDPEGKIGGWGWDPRTSALLPPTTHDLMGYCGPYGISVYHYAKLAERTRLVDRTPRDP